MLALAVVVFLSIILIGPVVPAGILLFVFIFIAKSTVLIWVIVVSVAVVVFDVETSFHILIVIIVVVDLLWFLWLGILIPAPASHFAWPLASPSLILLTSLHWRCLCTHPLLALRFILWFRRGWSQRCWRCWRCWRPVLGLRFECLSRQRANCFFRLRCCLYFRQVSRVLKVFINFNNRFLIFFFLFLLLVLVFWGPTLLERLPTRLLTRLWWSRGWPTRLLRSWCSHRWPTRLLRPWWSGGCLPTRLLRPWLSTRLSTRLLTRPWLSARLSTRSLLSTRLTRHWSARLSTRHWSTRPHPHPTRHSHYRSWGPHHCRHRRQSLWDLAIRAWNKGQHPLPRHGSKSAAHTTSVSARAKFSV